MCSINKLYNKWGRKVKMKETFYNLNLMGVSKETVDYLEDYSFDESLEVVVILKDKNGKEVTLKPDDCQLNFEPYEED